MLKVVFLGLDAAGKTTILNILSKKYSFISKISPTKTIERRETSLGLFEYKILNWDVPGQQKFREELTFNERTLQDSNVLIFVIDAQDIERTGKALNYFQRVLQRIVELESVEHRPYILVLIHKMDPDLNKDLNTLRNVKYIQDELNKSAIGVNIAFFLTSMFIQPTIFIAFSSIIRKALSKKNFESLQKVLTFFADELILNAVVILDTNNFLVSHFERTETDLKILQDFVYTLNSAYHNARTHDLPIDELKLIVKDLIFIYMSVPLSSGEVFVVGSSHDPDVSLLPVAAKLKSAFQKAIK